MKKLTKFNSIRQLITETKGATMVEYALMLALILVVAYVAVGKLGTQVNTAVTSASTAFGGGGH
jgi:Flp pilus assembly pilin Flp